MTKIENNYVLNLITDIISKNMVFIYKTEIELFHFCLNEAFFFETSKQVLNLKNDLLGIVKISYSNFSEINENNIYNQLKENLSSNVVSKNINEYMKDKINEVEDLLIKNTKFQLCINNTKIIQTTKKYYNSLFSFKNYLKNFSA